MVADTKESPNDAAQDLWAQIFSRAAKSPIAAIMDPEHDEAADEAVMRAGFAASGWSAQEIKAIAAGSGRQRAAAPVTSPGVNPSAEHIHALLCNDIETEMARQGLESQHRVARGIEPCTRPFAAKIGVIMTDQSVVTVGAFTFRFCGLIAKAFTRSIRLNPQLWEANAYTKELGTALFSQVPNLILYWQKIYLSFAMTGTNVLVPFHPATKKELMLVEQVARAMELFVVGHEYGHHHLGHGKDLGADAHAEEFTADQFALRICKPLGEAETPIWNPYLASGAGGVIMLKSLDTLRRCEIALGGKASVSDTHPNLTKRIQRFDSVALIRPDEFRVLKGFRLASWRVMDLVGEAIAGTLENMPADQIKPLVSTRNKIYEQDN